MTAECGRTSWKKQIRLGFGQRWNGEFIGVTFQQSQAQGAGAEDRMVGVRCEVFAS